VNLFILLILILLRDKLPTKVNLVSRGIITLDDHLCIAGCGSVETAQHLFHSCSFFVLFGRQFGLGLTSLRWIRTFCLTISSSSLTQQVVLVLADLFSKLFGSYVCGLCGMNAISYSLETKSVCIPNFWTRSNFAHISG
jgi:hypothetical protein